MGGIGYYDGASIVSSKDVEEPRNYWKAELFSGSPSRSFFPRGFLWDEGFHQLVLQKFDVKITIDVLSSWLNLMNTDGWIPREQILGAESRARVPKEFVVQSNDNANPPSFFVTIETLLDKMPEMGVGDYAITKNFITSAYPRLVAWFKWFNTTQNGNIPGSYYWRGRNAEIEHELNPKTLASGLDDYPRASHPDSSERHLDLYCWMAYASGILARIARRLDLPDAYTSFRSHELYLRDENHFNLVHWSKELGYYADYGLDTKEISLCPAHPEEPGLKRCVNGSPRHRFVDAFGYVSLFPIMLTIIEPESPKLEILLDKISDRNRLCSGAGLRSLSKSSWFFKKRNTEHDPPYWRGAIWMNMNYLTLRGLNYYARTAGPYQTKAQAIFNNLKTDLIEMMWNDYRRSHTIWEHYDEVSESKRKTQARIAEGAGAHPFTGWSSLILLIMGDHY